MVTRMVGWRKTIDWRTKMKQWYLLYCKRGEQERAQQHLENQKVECYYPVITRTAIRRGKRQTKPEPLFPCYVFICFDPQQGPAFTTIRSTRGVVDFVRRGAMPQVVSPDLIEGLKSMESMQPQDNQGIPKAGQPVSVLTGPFAGVEAIYKESDGELRSILLVKLLNQHVEVSVGNQDFDV